ncbi:MAG: hypothetical protein GY909_15365 [Oligoflexia bacterium]|nr:hypothetical protein [Oligoflexia bacterium]
MELLNALKLLNEKLALLKVKKSIYITGGMALILLKKTTRATQDVDVIAPRIDEQMKGASQEVAKQLGLDKDWLNNAVSLFASNLPDGWIDRAILIHNYSNLDIYSVSIVDLAILKIDAMFSRAGRDYDDLLSMNLSDSEIDQAINQLKNVPHLVNDKKYQESLEEVRNSLKKKD